MSSGFNTDVKVGDRSSTCKLKIADPNHPIIDTAVYQNGRILHRRASNYEQEPGATPFTPEELRRRVEEQHRAVIEAIRSGALDAEIASAESARKPAGLPAFRCNCLIRARGFPQERYLWSLKFRGGQIASRKWRASEGGDRRCAGRR